VTTLKQTVILAADDTLATADRLELDSAIVAELDQLRTAKQTEDFEKTFIYLDRIRGLSAKHLITSDPAMRRPLSILAGRTFDHVQAIVLHPDYKPPRGHP
jgi:hypothetical protein